MSYSVVEVHSSKEDIFKRSDDECKKLTRTLRRKEQKWTDEDFPPKSESLGFQEYSKNEDNSSETWEDAFLLDFDPETMDPTFELWINAEPFHVYQGNVYDCWLLAPLMTIAKKTELLKQILPKREYSMDTRVVQVRLCIDEKWQVIRVDSLLPHQDMRLMFAYVYPNQQWVALIEKAVAKVKGSYYYGLYGWKPRDAFKYLTGCYTKTMYLNKLMDVDKLWEELKKNHASGFLMCASTPNLDDVKDSEEVNVYKQNSLFSVYDREYAILEFQEHDGHRLIQMSNPRVQGFTGKWSDLPNYPPVIPTFSVAVYDSFDESDKLLAENMLFWMSIEDFVRFFSEVSICEYREKWEETRFKQTVKREVGEETLVLRLVVTKRCKVVIDVNVKNVRLYNVFLNFHNSTFEKDYLGGKLIHSAHNYGTDVTSGVVELNKGVYSVVMAFVDENLTDMEFEWVLRSPTIKNASFDMVMCPFTTVISSIQQVILQYGVAHYQEADNIVIYTWKNDQSLFVMVDNRKEEHFIRVKGTLSFKVTDGTHQDGIFLDSVPVPPKYRQIVGFVSCSHGGKIDLDVKIEYKVRWRFWECWDWSDYEDMVKDLEMHEITSLQEQ